MESAAYRCEPPATVAPATGLPPRARVYLLAVAAAAGAAALTALTHAPPGHADWLAFVPLVLAAAVAHIFATRVPGNQVFHTGMAFTVAAALLLPPQLLLLVCVIPHCADWMRQRYAWYIQTFNICNYVVSALAAFAAAGLASAAVGEQAPHPSVGIVAAVTFVAVNHALLAPMLVLARGRRISETRLFSLDGAMPDLVLALLGAGTALALDAEPWALPIVLAPLVLIHRVLTVPGLLTQTRTDSKTGLFNRRHFLKTLDEELLRAKRFGRPLSVLVADLDLRRGDDRHGHRSGEAVFAGVADVLRTELRPYDVPARFGGEAFAILLPETDDGQARGLAERIRAAAAARTYAAGGDAPVRVTVSVGLASFPRDARRGDELVRRAGEALDVAKRGGRDRVAASGEVTAGN